MVLSLSQGFGGIGATFARASSGFTASRVYRAVGAAVGKRCRLGLFFGMHNGRRGIKSLAASVAQFTGRYRTAHVAVGKERSAALVSVRTAVKAQALSIFGGGTGIGEAVVADRAG